ncbi:MAG: pH regulation protein F [Firmicutes bacterium]|nr:pH regulation protein F [Bacillota bacterium]
MLIRLFRNAGVYNRFIGILVMCTNVILMLILIGFIDGRRDMYVDIAISYAVLGFISSVIVAKILGSKGGGKDGR